MDRQSFFIESARDIRTQSLTLRVQIPRHVALPDVVWLHNGAPVKRDAFRISANMVGLRWPLARGEPQFGVWVGGVGEGEVTIHVH